MNIDAEEWRAAFGEEQWQLVEKFALRAAAEKFTLNLPFASAPVDSNEMLRGDIHELEGLVHALLTKVSALEAAQSPTPTPVCAGIVQPRASKPEMALMTPTRAEIHMPLSVITPAPTFAGFLQETEDPEEDWPESINRQKRA